MDEILRIYDPNDVGPDGYPIQWHLSHFVNGDRAPAVKDYVRELAGHRCVRCRHPYLPGIAKLHPRGEWTPCDEQCSHTTPFRMREIHRPEAEDWRVAVGGGAPVPGDIMFEFGPDQRLMQRWAVEAHWRILTVHHLNGVKWDCRWWNLAALCQRCHLTIQGKVVMENVWGIEHSEWFKPYAAGWYAVRYLGEELSREEVMARLDELLSIELTQERLEGFD